MSTTQSCTLASVPNQLETGLRLPVAGAALFACLAIAAGCDSQSQLAANLPVAPGTVAATESISVVGTTTALAYQISRSSLPAQIASGGHVALVLGGRAVPVSSLGPLLVANLPPNSPPLQADASGDVAVLIQSDGGSAILNLHVGTILMPLPAPQATVSVR